MINWLADRITERSPSYIALLERAEAAEAALAIEVRGRQEADEEIEARTHDLRLEQTKRIAAESIASERAGEISRLRSDLEALRAQLAQRMASLDALNVKILEPRAAETPTLDNWKQAQEAYGSGDQDQMAKATREMAISLVRRTRKAVRDVDQAILAKQFPHLAIRPEKQGA